jgi:hypothetical protein
VLGRHGLVDFLERMVTQEGREVDAARKGQRPGSEFDPLLWSQRAEGAAPASVAGWWFKGRALDVGATRHGRQDRFKRRLRRGVISLERLKDY